LVKEMKEKKRRWDAILVAFGMVIGFSIVIMKITGYWPCVIANVVFEIKQVSCTKPIQENVFSVVQWIQEKYQTILPPSRHLLLQPLQSI